MSVSSIIGNQCRPKTDQFGECQPLRAWTRTPCQACGGILNLRLGTMSQVEVGIEMVQEGVIVAAPDDEEPTLRAIAEVYARC